MFQFVLFQSAFCCKSTASLLLIPLIIQRSSTPRMFKIAISLTLTEIINTPTPYHIVGIRLKLKPFI